MNKHNEILRKACLDNQDAYDYLTIMSKTIRIWDDLIDRDREVSSDVADEVFSALVFDLGRNKFFCQNRQVLESFLFLAWNAWSDSNAWKGHPDKIKSVCAWFLRDFCNEIVILVAWLVGGSEHARSISLECREFYLKDLIAGGLDGFLSEV